eukprot:2165808-Rhodomonas_salina.1
MIPRHPQARSFLFLVPHAIEPGAKNKQCRSLTQKTNKVDESSLFLGQCRVRRGGGRLDLLLLGPRLLLRFPPLVVPRGGRGPAYPLLRAWLLALLLPAPPRALFVYALLLGVDGRGCCLGLPRAVDREGVRGRALVQGRR